MPKDNKTPAQRFWDKVNKTETCWLWTGFCSPDGYAKFGNGGKGNQSALAHRWAYTHFVGPIPDGLSLDHTCRVRNCVNPAHLEPVSLRENTRRGTNFVAEFMRRDRCSHGHAYTDENTKIRVRGRFKARVCRQCEQARKDKAKGIIVLNE